MIPDTILGYDTLEAYVSRKLGLMSVIPKGEIEHLGGGFYRWFEEPRQQWHYWLITGIPPTYSHMVVGLLFLEDHSHMIDDLVYGHLMLKDRRAREHQEEDASSRGGAFYDL